MQLFLDNINKHIHLTPEEQAHILTYMHPKKLRKKTFFLQEGEVAKYSAFVLEGCLRLFFVDANGFEHNLQFAIEDWWITDMSSYTTQKPGRLYIEALENCEVLTITRDDQQKLFDACPKFERYFRLIIENGFVSTQNRVLDNLSLPAMDRYLNFSKKYPLMLQRLPQVQIAAYLGITPEFLSKLRHQIARKES